MRPSLAGARRLIMRSKVELPAPERPITPMKPPGATEKDALSTAALVPKRHVNPSTTSMHVSRSPKRKRSGFSSGHDLFRKTGIHTFPDHAVALAMAIVRTLQLCDNHAAVRQSSTPPSRATLPVIALSCHRHQAV